MDEINRTDEIAKSTLKSEPILTEEQKQQMDNQKHRPISDFKRNKLIVETKRNWDLFYKRNEDKFFKDRHWTAREFEELSDLRSSKRKTLLEVGCGVGNFIYPLLADNINVFAYVCDISPRAINLLTQNKQFNPEKIKAFQCDVINEELSSTIPVSSIDIATLLFVLSAIIPENFSVVLRNIHNVLKPGGLVLFRDYGLYDVAQIRFGPGRKMGENWYVRQDGTFTYFFSEAFARSLFESAGFVVERCHYVEQRTVNVKEGIDVPRRFLQGKFKKPS